MMKKFVLTFALIVSVISGGISVNAPTVKQDIFGESW